MANALAEQSKAGEARFAPVLSLAGRTRAPVLPAVPGRRGGFGGVAGLVAYLGTERVAALVDATHPFARQMHANAAAACKAAGVPLVVVSRPAWVAGLGAQWTEVADMAAAAAALGRERRRVLLTVGQQELEPFRDVARHDYLIRSVEPPEPHSLPHGARCIAARGPFTVAGERALMQRERIEVLVTKNSGGSAVAAKLEAARELGIEVVMVSRPPPPDGPIVPDVAGVLTWLEHQAALRGV